MRFWYITDEEKSYFELNPDPKSAWDGCPNSDWMLGLLQRKMKDSIIVRKSLLAYLCHCLSRNSSASIDGSFKYVYSYYQINSESEGADHLLKMKKMIEHSVSENTFPENLSSVHQFSLMLHSIWCSRLQPTDPGCEDFISFFEDLSDATDKTSAWPVFIGAVRSIAFTNDPEENKIRSDILRSLLTFC